MEAPETPEALEALVEKVYTAFSDAEGGRDELGRPLPPYANLHDVHRGAWRQAVMAAFSPPAPAAAPAPPATPASETPAPERPPTGTGPRAAAAAPDEPPEAEDASADEPPGRRRR
jgi:hypothetical protein